MATPKVPQHPCHRWIYYVIFNMGQVHLTEALTKEPSTKKIGIISNNNQEEKMGIGE